MGLQAQTLLRNLKEMLCAGIQFDVLMICGVVTQLNSIIKYLDNPKDDLKISSNDDWCVVGLSDDDFPF